MPCAHPVQTRYRTLAALAAAALLACAGAAHAVVRNVPATFPTIQAAINASANGDEVVVAPGTYSEQINFLGKAIIVRSSAGPLSTTITGGGTAGPVVQFVTGESSLARLEGFRITGGLVDDADGAGLRLIGASPSIVNCRVESNQVTNLDPGGLGLEARGAGMSIDAGSPTLINVSFDDNASAPGTGTAKGGAIWIGGGAQVSISGGTFTNNRTFGVNGGAIHMQDGSRLTIAGAAFNDNYTESATGGAIYAADGNMTISNTTFTRNYSLFGAAGAISADLPERIDILGCTFTEQNSPDPDSEKGAVGAIEVYAGILNVVGSTFTDNLAQGGSGGGIFALGANVSVNGCTFDGNVAPGGSGAGIHVFDADLVVTNTLFTNNDSSGAGIYAENDSNVLVTASTFSNNIADGASGAGISATRGSVIEVLGSTFDGNTAPGGSGAGLALDMNSSAFIANSTFSNHDAPGGGAAVISVRGLSTITIEGSTIANSSSARAMLLGGGSATLRNTTFSDNAGGAFLGTNAGANNPTATVEDCSFLNTSGGSAGFQFNNGSLTVRRTLFSGQEDASSITIGGAAVATISESRVRDSGLISGSNASVLTAANTADVTLNNCLIFNNNGSNGAIRVTNAALVTANSCTFFNSAPDTNHATVLLSNSTAGTPARFTARNSIFRGPFGFGAVTFKATGTNTQYDIDTCNVEDGFGPGVNISSDDPFFVDPFNADFNLGAGSPAIDIGNVAFIPASVVGDLVGNTRTEGLSVDLGALESSSLSCNPAITIQPPATASTCNGGTINLNVAVTSASPLTYRWRKAGVTINTTLNPSANTATLNLPSVSSATAGSYDCVISNACGQVTTAASVVSVCSADFDCVGGVTVVDLFSFLDAWFVQNGGSPGAPSADFDGDGTVTVVDLFDFLDAWFAQNGVCGV